jgi:hypothetical protein
MCYAIVPYKLRVHLVAPPYGAYNVMLKLVKVKAMKEVKPCPLLLTATNATTTSTYASTSATTTLPYIVITTTTIIIIIVLLCASSSTTTTYLVLYKPLLNLA